MSSCEFCLVADSQLFSISQPEMAKRSRNLVQTSKSVVSCASCIADLVSVAQTFSKWQNRVGLSSAESRDESSRVSLAVIRNEDVTNVVLSKKVTSKYSQRKKQQQQQQQQQQQLKFACQHCPVDFDDANSLTTHEMLTHRCFHCSSVFPNRNLLQSHSLACVRDLLIDCPICHLRFPSESRLSSHLSESHREKSDEYTSCDKCDAFFVSKASLSKHRKMHNRTEDLSETVDKVREEEEKEDEPRTKRLRQADVKTGNEAVLKTYLRNDKE